MKVLQIGMGNNPGGVEAFVMNYYRQLSLKGIRFDFVSMYGEIAFHQEILSLGGQVFLVPFRLCKSHEGNPCRGQI